jgi:hypothetical protein
MPGLTESQGKVVRQIVQSVPDVGLGQLTTVLSAQMGEHTMSEVRDLIILEIMDRKVRAIVFSPFLSLCTKNQPGKSQSRFPFILPTLLWNALVERSPKLMAQARDMANRWESEDLLPYIFNQVCDEAVIGLQEQDPRFAPVIDCLKSASPDGVRELINFLRMAPVLRDVLLELPLWVSRMSQDDALSVRLAYRDVTKLSPNGPAKLFEVIYTNLDPPWPVLRIISAALDRPNDQSIDGTDLAIFGELMLDQSESLVEAINDLHLEEGASAGLAGASAAKAIIGITTEFEEYIVLSKNGPWGRRIARIKRDLTVACEKLIFQVELLLPRALPTAAATQNQKTVNRSPNMQVPPDPVASARLEAVLTFLLAIRPTASASGVGVLRSRIITETQEFLQYYANGTVDLLKDFSQDQQAVRDRVHAIAQYVALVQDETAAEQLRRRVVTVARR